MGYICRLLVIFISSNVTKMLFIELDRKSLLCCHFCQKEHQIGITFFIKVILLRNSSSYLKAPSEMELKNMGGWGGWVGGWNPHINASGNKL